MNPYSTMKTYSVDITYEDASAQFPKERVDHYVVEAISMTEAVTRAIHKFTHQAFPFPVKMVRMRAEGSNVKVVT